MPPSLLRAPRLLAALFALASLGAQAGAAGRTESIDRSLLDAAQGEFQLADGRALNLRPRSRTVEVRFDEQELQRWRPESSNVLVSPDGRQRLHLHREANGSVDRVSLETQRTR